MGKLNTNLKRHGSSSTSSSAAGISIKPPLNAPNDLMPSSSTTNSIAYDHKNSSDQGQRHHLHHHHLQQHQQPHSKIRQLQKHTKNVNNKKSTISPTSSLFNLLIKEKQFIDYNLNEENLIYRAEGNANLVLSLPDSQQVLRLRKSIKNDIDTKETTKKSLEDLKECIAYTKLISSIVNNSLTSEPQLVNFEIKNLNNFNNWLLNFRPADRLDKEIRCRFGTLYPDVAFLPKLLAPSKSQVNVKADAMDTFCVEIKPKQGWTYYHPCNEFVLKNPNIDSTVEKCRFCCMQFLKLENGAIHEISKYCPIDLFSGIPHRMHQTIQGLISTPQNNLRIFKNGTQIYGDKMDSKLLKKNLKEIFNRPTICSCYRRDDDQFTKENLNCVMCKKYVDADDDNVSSCNQPKDNDYNVGAGDDDNDDGHGDGDDDGDFYNNNEMNKFIQLLIKILLNDAKNTLIMNSCKITKDVLKEKKCEAIDYNHLPKETALRKVLDLQLLAKTSLDEIQSLDESRSLSDYIDGLLKKHKLNSSEIPSRFLDGLDVNEKYLIGATALDCSMMLAFRKTNKLLNDCNSVDHHDADADHDNEWLSYNKSHSIQVDDLDFLTNITVMDLDPKPPKHFAKYLKQTQYSHDAYKRWKDISSTNVKN